MATLTITQPVPSESARASSAAAQALTGQSPAAPNPISVPTTLSPFVPLDQLEKAFIGFKTLLQTQGTRSGSLQNTSEWQNLLKLAQTMGTKANEILNEKMTVAQGKIKESSFKEAIAILHGAVETAVQIKKDLKAMLDQIPQTSELTLPFSMLFEMPLDITLRAISSLDGIMTLFQVSLTSDDLLFQKQSLDLIERLSHDSLGFQKLAESAIPDLLSFVTAKDLIEQVQRIQGIFPSVAVFDSEALHRASLSEEEEKKVSHPLNSLSTHIQRALQPMSQPASASSASASASPNLDIQITDIAIFHVDDAFVMQLISLGFTKEIALQAAMGETDFDRVLAKAYSLEPSSFRSAK